MIEPTFSELRALAAVAAHRNFRLAAKTLQVSASSLSHAVAGLEKRLGVRMFNRTTRSVSLTDAGRDFLARVQPALALIDAAVETVNAFRSTPAGLLRINGSEAGFERLMPYVTSFAGVYPDVHIDLVCEGRPTDIVGDGFDAGLRLAESIPQDMVSFSLGTEEAMIVVGAPDYIARRGAPAVPEDLLAHACIRARLPSGSIMRWEFERHGHECRIDVPGNVTLGGDFLTLLAARAGLGLAQVTAWSAAEDLAAGRLVQVLADWTPPFAGVCLYYPQQRLPSAGLRAFIDHCQVERRRGVRAMPTPGASGPLTGVSAHTANAARTAGVTVHLAK